jgi:pimeloyl-ACP methyl ester carboxylesterase
MTLAYDATGDGPTVLLLHSTVCHRRMWDPQVPVLARAGFRVVRCDLRGYGSTPLERGASYSDAEDVVALVEELGLASFALVGASYGGYVAQQVASTMPDRVERLVLLCSAGDLVEPDPGLRAFWDQERRLLAAGDVDGATELNVTTWLGPEADEDARDLVRTMQRAAFDHQLAAGDVDDRELPVTPEVLVMPVLVIVGTHDFDFFRDTARALVARLPRSEVVELIELDWAGHLPTLEQPDEGWTVLLDALTH